MVSRFVMRIYGHLCFYVYNFVPRFVIRSNPRHCLEKVCVYAKIKFCWLNYFSEKCTSSISGDKTFSSRVSRIDNRRFRSLNIIYELYLMSYCLQPWCNEDVLLLLYILFPFSGYLRGVHEFHHVFLNLNCLESLNIHYTVYVQGGSFFHFQVLTRFAILLCDFNSRTSVTEITTSALNNTN